MTRMVEIWTKQDYSRLTRELTEHPEWKMRARAGMNGSIIAEVTES